MDSDAEPIVFHALRDYVAQHPFPEPPAALRTLAEQKALSLRGLTQSLQAPNGAAWGYAHEEEWPRKPFADFLSTIVRLTDQIPDVVPDGATVTPGGSVIANDAIYFLTENAEQWRKTREQAARNSLALQNPDGSFFYRTRFPDVESAMTSTGYTAITALEIMEYIHVTGNQELFQQLKPTLDFLSHASFPRGGFYHDSPLHTPDLLTAASMVWLHVWAYELTNEKHYLEQAKRFALAGLPFVYLQNAPGGTHENRLYLTIPKWGGTNRHAPVDFGVTNTNTGITFAYALHLLAPHDPETNWNLVARGILHAVERIQHTTGPAVGCVPEKFDVVLQKPLSWNVNPCGLVSLRNALDGNLNGLYVLETPFGRYASPYPLQSTVSGVDVRSAPENKPFQILRNGYKVIQATGPGPVSID